VVLRLLILKHVRNWRYGVLEREVRANLVYRDFTRVGADIVPGRRMRVDTTVVETNIHYPTDSSLLGDGVRVLTRTMRKITELAGAVGAKLARDALVFLHPEEAACEECAQARNSVRISL
jgi:IS5 family transposase